MLVGKIANLIPVLLADIFGCVFPVSLCSLSLLIACRVAAGDYENFSFGYKVIGG